MKSFAFPISRRTMLKGVGATLALPWLEAMIPSGPLRAATPTRIKRFLHIYLPNGASTLWWKTTGSGKGDAWQLSPLLSDLLRERNEHAQSRAVDIPGLREVDEELLFWPLHEVAPDNVGSDGRREGIDLVPERPDLFPRQSEAFPDGADALEGQPLVRV